MTDLNPSDYTIDELEDEIESIDDSDALHELFEAEADGDDRAGAKEAIEQRLQVVEDQDQDQDEGESDGDGGTGANAGTITEEDDRDNGVGVIEIRDRVRGSAGELIGRELDGITEIQASSEQWTAIVEVVERRSVPDTQDILGRYEIQLDTDGAIRGYRRLKRYRRGDTDPVE